MQKAVYLNSLCSITQSWKTIIAYFTPNSWTVLRSYLQRSICSACLVDDCSLCQHMCQWMCVCIFAGLSGGCLCLTWNYGGNQSCAVVIPTLSQRLAKQKGYLALFQLYLLSHIVPPVQSLPFKVSGLTFSSFSWQIEKNELLFVLHLGEFWKAVTLFSAGDSHSAWLRSWHNEYQNLTVDNKLE